MFVTRINIARDGYYSGYGGKADPAKPFMATVEVHNQRGKIELVLDPQMSARIVEVIADEIAAAGKATAEAMTANFITGQKQIAA